MTGRLIYSNNFSLKGEVNVIVYYINLQPIIMLIEDQFINLLSHPYVQLLICVYIYTYILQINNLKTVKSILRETCCLRHPDKYFIFFKTPSLRHVNFLKTKPSIYPLYPIPYKILQDERTDHIDEVYISQLNWRQIHPVNISSDN